MNLNDYLALTRITQVQAAEQLGCGRSLIHKWCSGRVTPGRYWWSRIQAWSRGAITTDVPKAIVVEEK